MAGLEFRNITKQLNDDQKIENLSLEVGEGELVALVGPNECGKAELIRMAEGYGGSYTGEVYIDRKRLSRFSRGSRSVSLINDVPLLGTPRWEITRLLKAERIGADEVSRRLTEAVRLSGAEEILDVRYSRLNAEQKMRAGMARALAARAKVALFIDPLVEYSDPHMAARMRLAMLNFREKSGMACLMSTNSAVTALALSTRVVVMNGGKVLQSDTPQNVYDYPADRFVAEYFGTSSINLIPVKLEKFGEEVYASFGESRILVPAGKISRLSDGKYVGGEVLMGVRAENVHYEQLFLTLSPESVVEAKVRHVELMGSDTYLHLEFPGVKGDVLARVDPRCIANPGDTLSLGIDSNHLHFFDPKTGISLLKRA